MRGMCYGIQACFTSVLSFTCGFASNGMASNGFGSFAPFYITMICDAVVVVSNVIINYGEEVEELKKELDNRIGIR
jgi:hypothetical protein